MSRMAITSSRPGRASLTNADFGLVISAGFRLGGSFRFESVTAVQSLIFFGVTICVENSATGSRSSKTSSASASHSSFNSGVSRLYCGSGPKEIRSNRIHHGR